MQSALTVKYIAVGVFIGLICRYFANLSGIGLVVDGTETMLIATNKLSLTVINVKIRYKMLRESL